MRHEYPGNRPPPKQVRMLLPIWGHKYVRDFLNISLPTWLAPGNLPAVAETLPTELVLLTSRDDERFFSDHPAFRRLTETCKVTFHYVDHFITGKNYSTTITLSYLEAVRQTGPEMTDTCFFFLVSDYIVANGSFRNALQRIIDGRSGLLVGNFQLSEEAAQPWLDNQLRHAPEVLCLESRQLMRWGLAHLHPNTIANTVNVGLSHNSHTNRLFWSVDSQTLIGRFYLMHMICIRPELDDFTIGSACDYSFIPQMCPSDNVEIIADSDDYLVMEMQPNRHESAFLKPGHQTPRKLAYSLSEWTTARHRENAKTTILFHAGDKPANYAEIVGEADRFIDKVSAQMKKAPVTHANHPYWTGAIASQKEATGVKLDDSEWRMVFGMPDPRLSLDPVRRLTRRLIVSIFGRPPHVRRWHPRWPDYQLVLNRLDGARAAGQRMLMLTDRSTVFTAGMPDGTDKFIRMRSSEFMRRSPERFDNLREAFDICLIELDESDFRDHERFAYMSRTNGKNDPGGLMIGMDRHLDQIRTLRISDHEDFGTPVVPLESLSSVDIMRVSDLVDKAAPLVRNGGSILLSITSSSEREGSLESVLAHHAGQLRRPYARRSLLSFVRQTPFRKLMLQLQKKIAGGALAGATGGWLAGALMFPLFLVANALTNLRSNFVKELKPGQFVSSALFEYVVDAEMAGDIKNYSAHQLLNERLRERYGGDKMEIGPDETIGTPVDIRSLLAAPNKTQQRTGGAQPVLGSGKGAR